MPRQIQGSQTDFSGGEFDVEVKRDDATAKIGGRQCSNLRILNSKNLSNRPGRSILFVQGGRTEEVLVAPGAVYKISFGGDGSLVIRNTANAVVASQPAATYPWATATLQKIVWDKVKIGAARVDVLICFPGMKPQIASFDGVATWTFSAFAFQLGGDGIEQVPFYRIAAPGITMLPSGVAGSVTVTFSAPVLLPAHVGAIFRYCNIRLRMTAYTSSTVGTFTWIDGNATQQILNFSPGGVASFRLGDVIIGTSGTKALITVIYSTSQIGTQLLNNFGNGFSLNEVVTGPSGTGTIVLIAGSAATAASVWDEQICSDARGWPQSVFVDQNRVGLCNLPGVPAAIAWSAIGIPYGFSVGALPGDAMVEITPFNSQVLFVVPGPESSEFVFCDRAIFYIPISPANPLKPGSVAFQIVSNDGCAANVQPRPVQEVIIYVNVGLDSVRSIVATGAYNRPYETRNISDLHNHLLNTPLAIALPAASAGIPERYGYVLNTDGTVAVFKYSAGAGQLQGTIGWTPWSGVGTVQWIAALGSDVLFSSTYFGVKIIENIDPSQYLDCAILVNSVPAALTPPGGKGPLWFIPSQTVALMDLGTRYMGVYQIDANGFIVPQFNGGENLLSAQLVAGQPWISTFEPFATNAQPGADVHQRMKMRQISLLAVYVLNATGYLLASLFSGRQTPTAPALGTVMNQRRIPDYYVGEDATLPPILRETVETYPPQGSSFDPRAAIIKDTPGPLTILEVAMEISV